MLMSEWLRRSFFLSVCNTRLVFRVLFDRVVMPARGSVRAVAESLVCSMDESAAVFLHGV